MAASLPPASLASLRLLPRPQIVATRGRISTTTDGAGGTNYTRFESYINVYTGPRPVYNLQLCYCNRYAGSKGEYIDVQADITSLEGAIVQAGWNIPATFNGTKTPPLALGSGLVKSDEFGLIVPANTQLQIRSAAVVASGGLCVVGQPNTTASAAGNQRSTSTSSQTYTTNSFSTTAHGGYGFVPVCLLGVPDQPHPGVLIWGDSWLWGTGSSTGDLTYGHIGWAERAMIGNAAGGGNVPFANVSKSGDATDGYTAVTSLTRRALFRYATHVIFNMIGNDIPNIVAGSTTLAASQANLRTIWAAARALGCKVYHCTMNPRTTSTDAWATTANQTVVAGFESTGTGTTGVRGQFNTWLGAQLAAGNIDGIFDVNSVAADSGNPDKWVAGGTVDGQHPTATLSQTIASAMGPAVRAWT